MVEDKLLILKFKLGDKDALRRIYEKYKNDLLKLAIALLNDVNTAEDVVEEVFTAFAQSAATIRISGNLKSYLTICIANRIRNKNVTVKDMRLRTLTNRKVLFARPEDPNNGLF